MTVITTNLQHPTSIAVQWAARLTGKTTVFVEHATTPALVFKLRGYERFYVNFEHTRRMMIAKGAPEASVRVMGEPITPVLGAAGHAIRRVGICINDLDSFEAVADVTEVLQRRGLQIGYRVHDGDPRLNRFRSLAAKLGIEFSSARASKIADYIAGVDLVIAGNSNVVADALRARTPVLYYWSGREEMFDYYGIISYYALPYARSRQALDAALAELTRPGVPC